MTRKTQLRVLIVSDTHGFLDPRIEDAAADCQLAVHAGDIMGAEVLERLRAAAGDVVAVRGNNDVPAKWDSPEAGVLAGIADQELVELPGGTVAVVHGHRVWDYRDRHGRLRRMFPQARAVIYGHSHQQVVDLDARPWVLNPGAGGRNRTFGGPSCLVLHAGPDEWRVEPLRFPPLRRERLRDAG
jgi:putative phosphoesterase